MTSKCFETFSKKKKKKKKKKLTCTENLNKIHNDLQPRERFDHFDKFKLKIERNRVSQRRCANFASSQQAYGSSNHAQIFRACSWTLYEPFEPITGAIGATSYFDPLKVERHLKGEVYPKIKFSPVVVFGVLSRMVLVRGS